MTEEPEWRDQDRGKLAEWVVLDWLNVNGAAQGDSTTVEVHVHPHPSLLEGSTVKKIRRTAIITALSGALVTGVGVSQAAAAPNQSPARHTITSSATAPIPASQTAPAPLPAAPVNATSPNADSGVPIAVRLAVKAAMAVLKKTNVKWYNKIKDWANGGRESFVKAWDRLPAFVKGIFGGIAGNTAYDAIRWVLGI